MFGIDSSSLVFFFSCLCQTDLEMKAGRWTGISAEGT